MLFCIEAGPFYIPTNRAQRSQFLHILTVMFCFCFILFLFSFWRRAIRTGMRVDLTLVFFFVSLTISDLNVFSYACCHFYLFTWRETEGVRAGEGQTERENLKQAPCRQSAQSPTRGSISGTVRSRPELKSRMRCLTD